MFYLLHALLMRTGAGAHTIGQAQCANFRNRLYGESNLNQSDAAMLRVTCPQSGGSANLAPMDLATPNTFDGAFFSGLLSQRGVLHTDQVLFSSGSTDALVHTYATNAAQFRNDFAEAMVRMGSIGVLTGSQGQISLLPQLLHCQLVIVLPGQPAAATRAHAAEILEEALNYRHSLLYCALVSNKITESFICQISVNCIML